MKKNWKNFVFGFIRGVAFSVAVAILTVIIVFVLIHL
jgi:tetrahydromethanopterin S-methyltransferase subunit B